MRHDFVMLQLVYYEDGTFKNPYVGWDFDNDEFTFCTKDKAMCFPYDRATEIIGHIIESFRFRHTIFTIDIFYI